MKGRAATSSWAVSLPLYCKTHTRKAVGCDRGLISCHDVAIVLGEGCGSAGNDWAQTSHLLRPEVSSPPWRRVDVQIIPPHLTKWGFLHRLDPGLRAIDAIETHSWERHCHSGLTGYQPVTP